MKRINNFESNNNYHKLISLLNKLKYEDGSNVKVKYDGNGVISGFHFELTDIGVSFEDKIDNIVKECYFSDWLHNTIDSIYVF